PDLLSISRALSRAVSWSQPILSWLTASVSAHSHSLRHSRISSIEHEVAEPVAGANELWSGPSTRIFPSAVVTYFSTVISGSLLMVWPCVHRTRHCRIWGTRL